MLLTYYLNGRDTGSRYYIFSKQKDPRAKVASVAYGADQAWAEVLPVEREAERALEKVGSEAVAVLCADESADQDRPSLHGNVVGANAARLRG